MRAIIGLIINIVICSLISTQVFAGPKDQEFLYTSSDLIYDYFVNNHGDYDGPYSEYLAPHLDPNRQIPFFLQEFGPLDHQFGIIGSASNLGLNGLFGNHPMNPQNVFRALKNWEEFAEKMTAMGGPGSEDGPISKILNKDNLLEMAKWMPAMNYVDGPLAELGVNFIQGVVGATGPNGTQGIWGYNFDKSGTFYDRFGKVVRNSPQVSVNGRREKFPLFEIYSIDRAKELSQVPGYHDSSFGVLGELKKGQKFVQSFTPRKTRWVSILLVKGYAMDQFRIRVLDSQGEPIPGLVAGELGSFSPFIRLQIPKNRRVFLQVEYLGARAQVRYISPYHYFTDVMNLKLSDIYRRNFSEFYRPARGNFRLFVTGAPTHAFSSGFSHGYLKSYKAKSSFKYQKAFDVEKRACEALFL